MHPGQAGAGERLGDQLTIPGLCRRDLVGPAFHADANLAADGPQQRIRCGGELAEMDVDVVASIQMRRLVRE